MPLSALNISPQYIQHFSAFVTTGQSAAVGRVWIGGDSAVKFMP